MHLQVPKTPSNSFRKPKNLSILRDRCSSVNVQVGNLFIAIENCSLKELQECVQQEPSGINGHAGPFFNTPLHFAVEMGWVDGVRELLVRGASVCGRNQYLQTPLHYAATAKQEEIIALLLNSSGSARAINIHDMRGMSPLHVAATTGCMPVVKLLLESGASVTTHDKQGESPLHKAAKAGAYDVMVALMEAGADLREKDLRGICAMRWLILSNTNGLQRLLDHLFITSDVASRCSPITFNFLPLVSNTGPQQCQLLSYFIETGNQEVLDHPICHAFLLIKWKTGKLVFLGYLLYFVFYALLTSLFIFMQQMGRTNETESINATLAPNDTQTMARFSFPRCMQGLHGLLWVMTLPLLITQLHRLRIQGRTYIKVPIFWLQLLSIMCVLSLLVLYWKHNQTFATLENNIGNIELLFLQLQFLFTLKKYPSHGLYVAMFLRVAKEFLKLFIVYCTLLVSFTAIMFLVFNTNEDKDPVNSKWYLLFLKSMTMMVGSVEVDDSLAKQLDGLPGTGYILFLFSVVFIAIVLANLLVALAVSDIGELRSSAHLTRLASMVEAILNMEQSFDFILLRRLANYFRLDIEATHVRLWPQHDVHHPSITVEVRKRRPPAQRQSRCCAWLAERFHPSRYQVSIPATLQDDVLARITARKTVAFDPDKLDVPHDYKVFFNEILRRIKVLEISHTH